MNMIQKAAVNMLLNYITDNPMQKLPKMFELAEKLDRGIYILIIFAQCVTCCWMKTMSGTYLSRNCSRK